MFQGISMKVKMLCKLLVPRALNDDKGYIGYE